VNAAIGQLPSVNVCAHTVTHTLTYALQVALGGGFVNAAIGQLPNFAERNQV
jgi:hypothetical protein